MKTHIKIALALTMAFFGVHGAEPVGKAMLGKIKSDQYVVTNESEFTEWKNSGNGMSIGYNASASWQKGIAIGMPGVIRNASDESEYNWSKAGTGTNYYWRVDYLGNVYANRESVAIGNAANAGWPVSVAIGDQAIVGELHTDSSNYYPVVLDKMVVSKDTTPYTTNTYANAITNWYDSGQYERLPEPDSGWTKIESGETVDVYEQKSSGALRDISYLTPEEYAYYNRTIYGGQGNVYLTKGYYGVAVGSRAYVFGYHSVALGHYAHVSRPWAMALGSEAHVYSEGAQGIGHDVDIATNAPYSLAVGYAGTIQSGMTNAIVIGVPDASRRNTNNVPNNRPTAVKANSINIVYHGEGIKDFYIDGKSLQDRLGNEVKVIGNSDKGGEVTSDSVRDALGIDDGDHIVFATGGKIMLYTKSYVEGIDTEDVHLDEIVINGKTLAEIIGDTDFKRKIQDAAQVAQDEISTNATNMVQVKEILNKFFNTIKQ